MELIGSRCNAYLRRVLPQDAPVKRLADVLGQSRQTAARLLAGDAPTSVQLVALASRFGKDFVAHVFEPVVGDMTAAAASSTLARVEGLLQSLRRPGTGAALGSPVPLAGSGPMTSTRLPLSEIGLYPTLLPHLERWRERSAALGPGEAVSLARADGNGCMSVNVRRRGDVLRHVYRARTSRLNRLDAIGPGEPVMAFPDRSYAALVAACAEETAQSPEPVLARVRGPVRQGDGAPTWIDVTVLRRFDRARDGTEIFTAHFAPMGQGSSA